MSRNRISCPHCGAPNIEGSRWCSRCLEPFSSEDAGRVPTASDPAPIGTHSSLRTRAGVIAAGALAIIFLAVGWRAFDAVSDHARLNPETIPGPLDPRGFRFIKLDPDTERPVRYNPCKPIRYVANLTQAPPTALQDIREAARLASEATGIKIAFEGETREVPSLRRDVYLPERYGERWPPIVIGWIPSDPRTFKEHDLAIAVSDPVENEDGDVMYVTGTMILNRDRQLSGGFDAGRTWGKVILHEWGHLLGLDHVPNPVQVMNGSLNSTPARWGTGDEAGLRELGRLGGCLDEPDLP